MKLILKTLGVIEDFKSEMKIPIFTFIVLTEFLMAVTWHISKGTKCIFDLNSDL